MQGYRVMAVRHIDVGTNLNKYMLQRTALSSVWQSILSAPGPAAQVLWTRWLVSGESAEAGRRSSKGQHLSPASFVW